MYNQFFGQFLLQKGLLTADQLCQAFEDESAVRVKVGVLAIDRGWMTAAQAEEVYGLQKKMDMRFGDIAVSKGYLGQLQVEELLQAQGLRHLALSQALLDRGYLNLAELTTALELYKRETGLGSVSNLWDDRIARLLINFPEAGQGQSELYYLHIGLFLRNIVRFLQVEPVLERATPFIGKADGWFISQTIRIEGKAMLTGLVLPDDVLIRLASIYSGETITEVNELALDSVGEFLNLHNGMLSINLCNAGREVEMLPQEAQKPAQTVCQGYAVSVVVPFGRLQLVVAEQ